MKGKALSKIIVITGAGIGLGRALARRFAADGDNVVLLGRTFSKVQAAAQEIGERAMAVACDVASPASVRAAFAEIAKRHPAYRRADQQCRHVRTVPGRRRDRRANHRARSPPISGGPILCSRAAIPMMGRGSHIINVSSESVDLPFPHLLLYQCSKAGLERFTLGLDRELEPSGIRVSTVRAGQMMEEGKVWNVDPAARCAFAKAAMEAGINLRDRPISQFTSVTDVFRALIDMPADLHSVTVTLHARDSSAERLGELLL